MRSALLPTELPVRFRSKVAVRESGCWEWIGRRNQGGYGRFYIGTGTNDQRYASAHRWSYERVVGEIPDGLDLDHLCRNRSCVNPAHLEPVTRQENIRRGVGPQLLGKLNGDKRQCVNGHEFTVDNTRIRRGGGRACRQCERGRRAARSAEQVECDKESARQRAARNRLRRKAVAA